MSQFSVPDLDAKILRLQQQLRALRALRRYALRQQPKAPPRSLPATEWILEHCRRSITGPRLRATACAAGYLSGAALTRRLRHLVQLRRLRRERRAGKGNVFYYRTRGG